MSEELDIMYCWGCGIEADEDEVNMDNWWWLNNSECMCFSCERNLTKEEKEKIELENK